MTARDLWAMLSGEDDTHHELRFRADADGLEPVSRTFIPVAERERFVRLVQDPCMDDGRLRLEDFSVSLVPRRKPLPEGMRPAEFLGMSRVVWARLDNGRQFEELQRFRPAPTVVLRHGSSVHRMAIWWISRVMNLMQVERANKRIAHALGTRKKWCDPATHVFVPGTVLRSDAPGSRPVVVSVEQASGHQWRAMQVFGGLRDAPEPRDWRAAA